MYAVCSQAQTDIATLWKDMPDSIVPILNRSARTELVTPFKGADSVEVSNALGGKTKMIKLSNKFLDIKLTNASGLQLLLLTKSDSTQIICMERSFGSPALESEISFYSTDWTRIDNSFGVPNLNDAKLLKEVIMVRPDSISEAKSQSITNILNPLMAKAELSEANGGTLTLSIGTTFLTEEEKNLLKNGIWLKELKWNGVFFK